MVCQVPSEWLENSFRSVSLGFCVEPTLQCSVDPLLNGAAGICKTSLLKPLGNTVAGKKMCIFVLLNMKLFR